MDITTSAALGVAGALLLSTAGLTTPPGWKAAAVLALLLFLIIKIYRIFLYHKYFSPLRHLPGPTVSTAPGSKCLFMPTLTRGRWTQNNHFLFGQSINFIRADSPIELYVKWMRQWPDAPFIRYLTFGNEEVIVANSIEAHKQIQQTHCYSFVKPTRFRKVIQEFAGNGILLLEGSEHRAHRKMLGNPLSVPNIRKLQPIFEAKSKDLCKLLDHAAASTGVIDCTEVFTKATLDIIGATVLGLDLENLSSETFETRQDSHIAKIDNSGRRTYSFHEAYEVIFEQGLLGKILLFANGFFPVRWIPIQENRKYKFCTDWVRRVLQQTISDRRTEVKRRMTFDKVESKQTNSRDLLTFIVEESMPGHPAESLKEDNFLGHLMQFMVAGHATSADAITWCVYILATRPDIQDKLRTEINHMLARAPHPTYNDINSCTYLENVIKEALRIYAPSTSHHRAAGEEVTIDGLRIPKGTTVDIVPSVTMLNPSIWGIDSDTPDPTRWDRLAGDQLSPYAFQAFANGSRICIGKSYAMLEMKCILIEIVPRYRFRAVDKPFTIENPGFAMRPTGLEVRLEKLSLVSRS
ncbi:hypothetical protein NW762_012066 [Fusarium torreyae]|uniref:Cytochrome P450 n=1 Tax=Fusarium torreyae TaxID=1237075 RepID=A0A9W8RNJ7_9HYPO|nr:hypothetical protein NW762_012066 [Fusarium torreyae]